MCSGTSHATTPKGQKKLFSSLRISKKRSDDDDLLVPRKCLFLPVEFLLTLDALNRFWGRKRKMGERINDAEMMWMWLLLLLLLLLRRRLMPQGGGRGDLFGGGKASRGGGGGTGRVRLFSSLDFDNNLDDSRAQPTKVKAFFPGFFPWHFS